MTETSEAALDGARLGPLLTHVSDGIFVVDADCRVLVFNPAAEAITGVDAEAAIGRRCHEIFTGAVSGGECAITRREECTILRVFKTGIPCSAADVLIAFPGGKQRTLSLRAVPLFDAGGGVVRVAVIMHDVSELRELREELEERYEFHNIIGKNHQMQEVFRLIEQIADSDATVLIEGESGTGKELVARAIHFRGPRSKQPFVQVNCSALVETLLESELFGHVRGAFTGAVRDKIGRFEAANKGTIFLDEIGDISPAVQVKLLRVIQERTFERVGESEARPTDVRIISATNRDLRDLRAKGLFREDLYYRLRVVPLHLPPLRERRDDIPLLVGAFVERFREQMGRPITGVSQAALARMMDYDWPGNVRELENAIEHAFVRCTGTEVQTSDLPVEVRSGPALSRGGSADVTSPASPSAVVPTLRPSAMDERAIIEAALRAVNGNKTLAAKRLGIGRTTLWRRINELNISWPKYDNPFHNDT